MIVAPFWSKKVLDGTIKCSCCTLWDKDKFLIVFFMVWKNIINFSTLINVIFVASCVVVGYMVTSSS